VLDALIEQIETVRVDGNYYRQRTEQLANAPAALAALEETRRGLHHEVAAHERRLAKIHAALAEASTIATQRAEVQARMADATQQLAAVPAGYDPGHHEALRASLVSLQQVETQCTRLAALVEGEERTRAEWRRVQGALSAARERVVELEQRKQQLPADDASFVALRAAHEAASAEARRTELDALAAVGDAERARAALDSAEQARRDLARLQETLQALEADRQRHEELDRAFTDVRTDLNFQLRPELAEIASGLLDALTDGRYTTLEFDEEYRPLVLEDGVPKPVISGGEEDLCNLVLRLAISQMIADRAGQVFSLLILDEVFGSLDEARRANVMELLRRLNDRFEQVIVITHIEQVRDGLDRLVQVRFDETRGCSAVSVGA
jgi:exonuclease SbcC